MTPEMRLLPPKTLGFWIRMMRLSSSLSQDALAETAGLTMRTVQRVEAGDRASPTTRRCLARGLGYDNPDIFDDRTFVAAVTDLVDTLRAEQIKAEAARHPDHVKLEVAPVANGVALTSQIDRCEAWVFHCDEQATAEAQAEAALLFDNLQEYGDIWQELPPSGRLEAEASFSEMLASVAAHGLRVYQATRAACLASVDKSQAPMPFKIGYVTIVPSDEALSRIFVPKRG